MQGPKISRQLRSALRQHMLDSGGGNLDQFVDDCALAINEILDGYGTQADAIDEAKEPQ